MPRLAPSPLSAHAGDPNSDVCAREELVRRHLPLATRLAGRYRHTGEPQEDLQQVACIGLINAADRYDSAAGPFVRYAVPTIMGELKRHFRDTGWGMRVPRSLQERCLEVDRAVDALSTTLGRSPSPTDIAKLTGCSVEEVLEALEAASAYSPVGLDAPPRAGEDDGGGAASDRIGAEDPGYDLVELGQALGPAFRALPPREQAIVRLRFLEDLTQADIAERVGISQMQVSRLLRRSLERLDAAGREGEEDGE